MESKPLVVSKQKTEVVCGVPTQVVCTAFSSHILVVVTQFGKMGTLVSLEPSSVANDISKPVLTTKVLLGQDEVEWLGRDPRVKENPLSWQQIVSRVWSIWYAAPHTHTHSNSDSLLGDLCGFEGIFLPLAMPFTARQRFIQQISGGIDFVMRAASSV